MDFDSLRIERDLDKHLVVEMDYQGGVDWISDIKTNIILTECYNKLDKKGKVEFLDFLELSISILKFDISNSKDSIKISKNRNDDNDSWRISQHQLANIERKKKRKFIKNWIAEKLANPKNKKKVEDSNKFAVALDFANGKIDKLYDEGLNYTKIAEKLYLQQSEGHRPYISASIQRLTTGKEKNVFNDDKLIKAVKRYCNENNIKIIGDFNSNSQFD